MPNSPARAPIPAIVVVAAALANCACGAGIRLVQEAGTPPDWGKGAGLVFARDRAAIAFDGDGPAVPAAKVRRTPDAPFVPVSLVPDPSRDGRWLLDLPEPGWYDIAVSSSTADEGGDLNLAAAVLGEPIPEAWRTNSVFGIWNVNGDPALIRLAGARWNRRMTAFHSVTEEEAAEFGDIEMQNGAEENSSLVTRHSPYGERDGLRQVGVFSFGLPPWTMAIPDGVKRPSFGSLFYPATNWNDIARCVAAYVGGTPPEDEFFSKIVMLKDWLAAHGRPGMPVYLTEFGWTAAAGTWQPPVDRATQARYVARSLALAWSQGVKALVYFALDYRTKKKGEAAFSLIGPDGRPEAGYAAFAAVSRHFAASEPLGHFAPAPGVHMVAGRRGGRLQLMVWAEDDVLPFPAAMPVQFASARSLFGSPLPPGAPLEISPSPVFLETDASDDADVATLSAALAAALPPQAIIKREKRPPPPPLDVLPAGGTIGFSLAVNDVDPSRGAPRHGLTLFGGIVHEKEPKLFGPARLLQPAEGPPQP